MPYISKELRDPLYYESETNKPESAGELNYVITMLCARYLFDNGEGYAAHNEIIGALECAKLEFYRRMTAPYEDTKIKENGDVY